MGCSLSKQSTIVQPTINRKLKTPDTAQMKNTLTKKNDTAKEHNLQSSTEKKIQTDDQAFESYLHEYLIKEGYEKNPGHGKRFTNSQQKLSVLEVSQKSSHRRAKLVTSKEHLSQISKEGCSIGASSNTNKMIPKSFASIQSKNFESHNTSIDQSLCSIVTLGEAEALGQNIFFNKPSVVKSSNFDPRNRSNSINYTIKVLGDEKTSQMRRMSAIPEILEKSRKKLTNQNFNTETVLRDDKTSDYQSMVVSLAEESNTSNSEGRVIQLIAVESWKDQKSSDLQVQAEVLSPFKSFGQEELLSRVSLISSKGKDNHSNLKMDYGIHSRFEFKISSMKELSKGKKEKGSALVNKLQSKQKISPSFKTSNVEIQMSQKINNQQKKYWENQRKESEKVLYERGKKLKGNCFLSKNDMKVKKTGSRGSKGKTPTFSYHDLHQIDKTSKKVEFKKLHGIKEIGEY